MLLKTPPVAEDRLALFTAICQQCTLRGDYRELAILRVALLNGASYEYRVHVPFELREGATRE
jgi:alkylhydroperoxidase/carboxymuconolactone decarboxylase family protein YurZ